MKALLLAITLSVISLNTALVYAGAKFIIVNATGYKATVSMYPYQSDIAPGEVAVLSNPDTYYMSGIGSTIWLVPGGYDYQQEHLNLSFSKIDNGLFLLQNKGNSTTEHELIGPFQEGGDLTGILYMINATGYPIHWYAKYIGAPIFCSNDDRVLPNSRGWTVHVGSCQTSEVYATVNVGGSVGVKETNHNTGHSTNNVYVFHPSTTTPNTFVVDSYRIYGN